MVPESAGRVEALPSESLNQGDQAPSAPLCRPAAILHAGSAAAESFSRASTSYLHQTHSTVSLHPNGRSTMTLAIYLIAAAVVICGCLLFIGRIRSRD
jgi:hypothetical protein